MNPYILQGVVTAGSIMTGVAGMLVNSWVSQYRDEKHFYDTRFLDIDGDPDSADKGYFKDVSGKLIPIIVEKYSFGYCKKSRYVEGFEVTKDGKYGLPFKMSLKAFRSKEIRRVEFQLDAAQESFVKENFHEIRDAANVSGMINSLFSSIAENKQETIEDLLRLADRIEKLEKASDSFQMPPGVLSPCHPGVDLEQEPELAKSNRDVARSLDRLSTTMQHFRKAIVSKNQGSPPKKP